MATPNPEQFAKVMLWHLTSVRADLNQVVLHILSRQAMLTGKTHQQLLNEWNEASLPFHKKLYREALAEAGLQDDREDNPPPSSPGDDEFKRW